MLGQENWLVEFEELSGPLEPIANRLAGCHPALHKAAGGLEAGGAAEEFVAFGVDEEASFAGVAAEAAVDTVDAVADGGVDGRGADGEIEAGLVVGEEFADESPIGGGAGGAALVAAGISVDVQCQWEVMGGDETVEEVETLDDGFAGAEGIGIGLENDFVEDIHSLANALQQEHAHGIDIEIDRPDDGIVGIKRDRLHVLGWIEGIVGAIAAGGGEFGFEFLAEGSGIEFMGGGGEFGGIDVSSLSGGELEGGPIGGGLGIFETLVKVIATFGGADEEGAALAVSECGANDFEPNLGTEGGALIKDDEVETVATEGFGIVGSTDSDGRAGECLDTELGFGGALGPVEASGGFEALPDDALGLAITGTDIPNIATADLGGVQYFGESEAGFAEAAAGREDAETGGRVEDLELMSAEADDGFVGFTSLHAALHHCLQTRGVRAEV